MVKNTRAQTTKGKEISNFKTNSFASILAVGLKSLAPLLILLILTSKLGVLFYGEYVILLSLFSIFILLADVGLSMEIPKRISKVKNDLHAICEYATLFLVIKSAISLVLSFIIFFLVDGTLFLKIIIIICLFLKNIDPEILFIGLEKYSFIARINLISKVLHLLLLLIIDLNINGLEKVFLIQLCIFLVTNILYYYTLSNKLKLRLRFMSISKSIKFMRSSIEFYFARFFQNLYIQGSTYALSFSLPLNAVAIYSIALDFFKVGNTIIGSIGLVLFTTLNATRNFILLKKVTLICLLAQLCMLPVIYFIGGHVLTIMFDFDIHLLYELSIIFYITLVFSIINSFWGYPVFSAINKDRLGHFSMILMAVIYWSLLLSLYLSGNITIFAAVLCIVAAEFVGTVIRLIFAVENKILP